MSLLLLSICALLILSSLSPSSCRSSSSSSSSLPLDDSVWLTEYDGYGYSKLTPSLISFAPKVAQEPSVTHATLVLSRPSVSFPALRDFVVEFSVRTVRQLRQNSAPNAWECFWFVFNYQRPTTPQGKKTANYFMLKPNGVELGTMYDEVGQSFLFTSGQPKLVIGKWNTWKIMKVGQTVQAWIDGVRVMNWRMKNNKKLYDAAGLMGFYSEDAEVEIRSFKLLNRANQPNNGRKISQGRAAGEAELNEASLEDSQYESPASHGARVEVNVQI